MPRRPRHVLRPHQIIWQVGAWFGHSIVSGLNRFHNLSRDGMRLLRALEQFRTVDPVLCPRTLSEFVGQKQACTNLSVFVQAARARGQALDSVLFVGPPGLGKTTLARIVAHDLGAHCHCTAAPMITKPADLAGVLLRLRDRDVLFIDEVHRLSPAVEESLYSALDHNRISSIVGAGRAARIVNTKLTRFTLIGATTRPGLLSKPLRDRFGIQVELFFYEAEELATIVARAASMLGVTITPEAANEIASRSRGTARIAIQLLRRARDFSTVQNVSDIDCTVADRALRALDIDSAGLNARDRRYLRVIAVNHHGGPVGVDTIAATLSEQRETIEDIVEPYLLDQNFVERTSRGRRLTRRALAHLGLTIPKVQTQAEIPECEYELTSRRVLH